MNNYKIYVYIYCNKSRSLILIIYRIFYLLTVAWWWCIAWLISVTKKKLLKHFFKNTFQNLTSFLSLIYFQDVHLYPYQECRLHHRIRHLQDPNNSKFFFVKKIPVIAKYCLTNLRAQHCLQNKLPSCSASVVDSSIFLHKPIFIFFRKKTCSYDENIKQ